VTVVFTSDHGESFGEHGHYGHAQQMYEENLRIPLIIRDTRFEPRRVSSIVQGIDIMPTIVALSGAPSTSASGGEGAQQGQSVVPLLAGDARGFEERAAFSESTQFVECKAIHTPEFELIFGAGGSVLDDDFVAGKGRSKFRRRPTYKLYRYGTPAQIRRAATQHAGTIEELASVMDEKIRDNEARQLRAGSGFYTFFFPGTWRERARNVIGEVSVAGGLMTLGPGAEVAWDLPLPQPAQGLSLSLLATCRQPAAFFQFATDQDPPGSWRSVEQNLRRGGAVMRAQVDLTAEPSRTLKFRFHEVKPGSCELRGFFVEAEFLRAPGEAANAPAETAPGLDDETRRNLEALGYIME
jgi:hypothetical protein